MSGFRGDRGKRISRSNQKNHETTYANENPGGGCEGCFLNLFLDSLGMIV